MRKIKYLAKKAVPNVKLKKAREVRGWTQRYVAERIELPDYRTFSRWERGVYFPSGLYRQRLSSLFEMGLEELDLVSPMQHNIEQSSLPLEHNQHIDMLSKIPHPLTSFIGREQEVESICSLLQRTDKYLVTIFGAGGVGKTRLGLQVAMQMYDHFSDGVCFVSLESINDPTLVLPTIAQELGIHEDGTVSLTQRLQYFLYNKNLLLLLDTFEHVLPASSLIEAMINSCLHLKVLITSREVLHLQKEHPFLVSPLPLPDISLSLDLSSPMNYASVALFMQRAQAVRPAFEVTQANIEAVVKLCAHLDGLPLAIELAASRIRWLAPEALLARIQRRFRLLKNEMATAPERQRTLYNTVKWSYDLLAHQDKWLFRHLSVFIGGVSLDTIEDFFEAGEQSELDIVDKVISLLDKSLLQCVNRESANPYFLMLETIREYGLVCLQEHGELEKSQHSHAIFYLHMVEKAAAYLTGSQQDIWLLRLEQEQPNLHAALEWLITRRETVLALRFVEAFGKFCGLRGYWTAEQRWLKLALELPQLPVDQGIRARVLRRAGHLAYRFRDLTTARTLQEESVQISHNLDDKSNLAGALSGLGWVLYRQNEIVTASQLLRESVKVARETGDAWILANTLESYGRYMHSQGEIEEARAALQESILLLHKVMDKETTVRVLTTFAMIELDQGNISQAFTFTQESFKLAQELGTKPLIALALNYLGNVCFSQKAYEEAKRYFTDSIAIARDLGDERAVAKRQLKLVDIALAQGDLEAITQFFEEYSLHFYNRQNIPEIETALQRCQHHIEMAQKEVLKPN